MRLVVLPREEAMGTTVFIFTLVTNLVAGGAAIGTFFSTHPQEPPREEQSVSRETQKTNVPHDIASDKTQNEPPSAEER